MLPRGEDSRPPGCTRWEDPRSLVLRVHSVTLSTSGTEPEGKPSGGPGSGVHRSFDSHAVGDKAASLVRAAQSPQPQYLCETEVIPVLLEALTCRAPGAPGGSRRSQLPIQLACSIWFYCSPGVSGCFYFLFFSFHWALLIIFSIF